MLLYIHCCHNIILVTSIPHRISCIVRLLVILTISFFPKTPGIRAGCLRCVHHQPQLSRGNHHYRIYIFYLIPCYWHFSITVYYRLHSRGDNMFGSVRVCACVRLLWALSCLNLLTLIFGMWVLG